MKSESSTSEQNHKNVIAVLVLIIAALTAFATYAYYSLTQQSYLIADQEKQIASMNDSQITDIQKSRVAEAYLWEYYFCSTKNPSSFSGVDDARTTINNGTIHTDAFCQDTSGNSTHWSMNYNQANTEFNIREVK